MKVPATAQKFEQDTRRGPQPKSTKNPPMAAAIRTFVAEMILPPKPKTGPHHNLQYAAIIQAILSFARGVRVGATEISSDPSMEQIADICHSDRRTIERHMKVLRKHGQVTVQKRGGKLSNVFTVHKGTKSDTTTVVASNAGDQTRQLDGFDTTTPGLDTTTRSSRHDNSVFTETQPNPMNNTELEAKNGQNSRASLDNTSGVKPLERTTLEKTTPSSFSSPSHDTKPGKETKNGDRSDSNVLTGPPKSSKPSGRRPYGTRLKPLTAEMEANPTVIAWRDAKKSRQLWDERLRQIGFKSRTQEGYDDYMEARDMGRPNDH
jgi:DNA-binding transcriptional ArsR family regulator